MSVIRSS